MSFSRAPLKRFNEHIGCAPPPGSYDIKRGDLKGAASFDRSDRFKLIKTATGAALPPPLASPSGSVFVSPVRRTVSVDGLTEGLSARKEKNCMTLERKKQRLLEREIRCLVQQRGEQDRRLQVLEEELKKVEARLLTAVRERTGLAANVTTLERQRAELKKVNEFLKTKVSADTTKKRINSLTMELMEARNNLDVKSQELHVLQINTQGQINMMETDLQASKVTLSALQARNKDLEDLHQVMKTQNEELENENASLHAVIHELREEVRVLQGYLDSANDQIQDLCLKLQEKSQESNAASFQKEKLKQLEMELVNCMAELESTRNTLKAKEEEAQQFQQDLQASKDALWEVEKRLEYQELELKAAQKAVSSSEKQLKSANLEVQASQATVHQQEAELVRLREVLRRTERELDERVAHLEQKCLSSEEERNKAQEEGIRKIEELKMELISVQQTKRDERKRKIQLEQELATLSEELTKEKALVDSLTVLVEQERSESEEHLRQLKEEMEEVLGELAAMEEQEQKRQEVIKKSQEVVHTLQEEKDKLAQELNATKELFMNKTNDVESLKKVHLTAMKEFGETSAISQQRMSNIVSELESAREALEDAKKREKELEAEVRRVTQQLKEVMDKVVEHTEEEINQLRELSDERQETLLAEAKAREENAKILLEVQACLAQKDEEMKATEECHAALISQLQQELQLQTNGKDEALRQLEEQKNQSLTQFQLEREKDQKLLEETIREKMELIKELQEEREEKVQIQTILEEEKEALMAERKNCEQVRSEVLALQCKLEKVEEGRTCLLAEVEHKEQLRRRLETQLGTFEQDKDRLMSRLADVEQELVRFQTQLDLMEEKKRGLEQELETQKQGGLTLREQVLVLSQEKVALQWELEEQKQEHQSQLTKAQESSDCSEIKYWKNLYDDLFAKVRPFQEQLNAFAAERDALLNENGANQEELNKLADAYARLLGHQNQKQKIKHVVKLKDENISLKQEVSKLRTLVSRQKSDLEQLKSKLPGASRRRFDPSKAFQHDKENRHAEPTEALKEGNHNE